MSKKTDENGAIIGISSDVCQTPEDIDYHDALDQAMAALAIVHADVKHRLSLEDLERYYTHIFALRDIIGWEDSMPNDMISAWGDDDVAPWEDDEEAY